jgi:hypothetical protein
MTTSVNDTTTIGKEQARSRGRILRFFRKHYDSHRTTKVFPQSRHQRLRKLALAKSVPIKHVYSWKQEGSHDLVKSVSPLTENETTVSTKTSLISRLHIGRYNAGMMYNEVMILSEHEKFAPSSEGIIPAHPTFLVIVDTTGNKVATDFAIDCIYRRKGDRVGLCCLQTGLPNECVFIPTVKIDFTSILDRPGDASRGLFGSRKKNARIFADRDGINTASLQLLDRYLSEAKKRNSIDFRMIVLHDDGLEFDAVKHFVHCYPEHFVSTVASRVGGMKLMKY